MTRLAACFFFWLLALTIAKRADRREGSALAMDRGGIEPPTPGFSVLCSTN
jgi:hypothetical protein